MTYQELKRWLETLTSPHDMPVYYDADWYCNRCGEPWDSYGIDHDDMTPAEAKAFRAGQGCPSCPKVNDLADRLNQHNGRGWGD